MKNKITVTVGIPAYNEEGNIGQLIKSILSQKQSTFKLEEIIIASDGSTDKTEDIIKSYSKKYGFIKLISDGRRRGKAIRLNQIYSEATGDFIITFDADVVPADEKTLVELLKAFSDSRVVLAIGNKEPLKGNKFFQKINYAKEKLWFNVRKEFKKGNNVFNSSGSIMALKKSFAKSFEYPEGLVADQQFVYLKAIQQGLVKFQNNARVFYKLVDNYQEYLMQVSRFAHERSPVLEYFKKDFTSEYKVPIKPKIKAILKSFIEDPLFIILGIILTIWTDRNILDKDELEQKGMWRQLGSTKNLEVASKGLTIKDIICILILKFEKLFGIKPQTLTILGYHSVSEDKTIVDISKEAFQFQINHLKENFDVISLDDAYKYLEGRKNLRKPSVVLTFDDGYQDILKNLIPILLKDKLPAAFFVLADPQGANRQEMDNKKRLLEFSHLKMLQKLGFTIGSHTLTHSNLLELNSNEIISELKSSKLILEQELETKIDYFAYPKGFYNDEIAKVCTDSGYKLGLTTDPGFTSYSNNLMKVVRIGVDGSHTNFQFPVLLTVSGVYYLTIKDRLKKSQQLFKKLIGRLSNIKVKIVVEGI